MRGNDPYAEFCCPFCMEFRLEKDRVIGQEFCIVCLEGDF